VRVLTENRGNITRAAKALDMSRQNLQYRIKRYQIDIRSLRSKRSSER
jgi:arginine utilization regulatory protein